MTDAKKDTDMHPLDATEIELKAAAREWRLSERADPSLDDTAPRREAAWQRLKTAARAYGEAWRIFVVPDRKSK